MTTITPSLIVHGGSGDWPKGKHEAAIGGVKAAALLGWQMLKEDKNALDVIEQVARFLEDDPIFDAGRGSFVNTAGQVELDAIVMDGATLKTGAVAALRGIANPISVARLVMTETPHNLLVGAGAQAFASKMGIPLVAEESLLVDEELEKWRLIRKGNNHPDTASSPGTGTIGVVARDSSGNIAVATSTGGTRNKMPGRVGDSPLIGSGAYADNRLGGASGTGLGEGLMKVVICKTVCDLIGSGMSPQMAAQEGVNRLDDKRVNAWGGVIVIGPDGQTGFAYNAAYMARAFVQHDGLITAEI
jgi:beta-aspartyl-peptidase (threonine type)